MKCSRCGDKIAEDQAYVHQGKIYCEDCLMEIGLHAGKCEPWASYLAGKEGAGSKGTEGLTELQKKVYAFIKMKGKATRAEVRRMLSLSEAELDGQLLPLMHAELVKEKSEGKTAHLIAVR